MKTFETRRKLRTQRDISARQHDRVSRDLEYAQTQITELTKQLQVKTDHNECAAQVRVAHAAAIELERQLDAAENSRWKWQEHAEQLAAGVQETTQARDEAVETMTEYATELAKFGWTPPEHTEPEPADANVIEENVEEDKSMFFEVARDYKERNPHLAGQTTSWAIPPKSEDEDPFAVFAPPESWNGFTADTPVAPAKPRRRAAAARKPAES